MPLLHQVQTDKGFSTQSLLSYVLQRCFGVILVCVCVALFSGSTAYAGPPSVRYLTGPPIDPTSADTFYGTSTTHTAGLCNLNSIMCNLPRAIAIQELARTLSQGGTVSASQFTANAFEYVFKNIDTEFRYGLSKGSFGALLDQSGTPFDQAHLLGELLKQGIAAYPTAYSGIAVTYQAGVISPSASQFQQWTGITSAQVACQLLANGGIPFSLNGSTPTSCATVSGSISSISMSHIWVQVTISGTSSYYDPSFKTYTQYSGISNLAGALGCGTMAAPTCGSSALAAAIPSSSQGFDTAANAHYVQNVQYGALGTTLSGFATSLQHYIQQNMLVQQPPTGQILDIVGGQKINPASMPTTGALPYGAPTLQHSWSGDIPDQYRSRLSIILDALNVSLYADETYGYWLSVGTYYNSNHTVRYASLFYEREIGTNFPTTPNLVIALGTPTQNQMVALANSTQSGITTDLAQVTINADHPYAANSGTYADDTFSNTLPLGFWSSGNSPDSIPFYIVQAWGRTGRGSFNRASTMGGDKKPWIAYQGARYVSGSSVPGGGQVVLAAMMAPAMIESWLSQSSLALAIGDGMAQTRTQQQDIIGVVLDCGGYAVDVDAIGSLGVTSLSSNATASQAEFNTAVTALDALEGSALEQTNDSPDGGNSIRWFELTNEQNNRFYETTTGNLSSVEAVLTNYQTLAFGNPLQVIQNYLSSTVSPTFEMIVPKSGSVGVFSNPAETSTYGYGPTFAYSNDGTQIAYIDTTGLKGAQVSDAAPDPYTAVVQTTQNTKSIKPLTFDVNVASGQLTVTANPDLSTGSGEFPEKLSYQRSYNSSSNQAPVCPIISIPGGTLPDCEDAPDRRLVSSWSDNWQIDASFSNDGFRGLGYDSGLEASAAIAALFTIQNLNQSPSFLNYMATIFSAAWFQDQVGANAVVINRPPATETFFHLPDGRFNPRPGEQGSLTQTGARTRILGSGALMYAYSGIQFAETDAKGAVTNFTGGRILTAFCFQFGACASEPANFFKPDSWVFPDGMQLTFTYNWTFDTAQNGQYAVLSKVSNSFGRSLSFANDPNAPSDPNGYLKGFIVTDDSSRTAHIRNKVSQLTNPNSVSLPGLEVIPPDTTYTFFSYNVVDPYAGFLSARLSNVYLPLSATNAYLSFNFDGLRRVSSVVDANSNATTYYPASINAEEYEPRGALADALGNVTTQYFDQFAHLLQSTDPFGNVTAKTYDELERLTETTYPLGNYTTVDSYDVRSNVLQTTAHPAPGSVEAAHGETIPMLASFGEGSTVYTCSDPVTCNDPVSETNGNGYTTKYAWDPTLGVIDSVSNGYNTAGTTCLIKDALGVTACPATTFGYTGYSIGGSTVSLLTSKTEAVSSTVNTESTYSYNASNKYVLQTNIVDAGSGHLNLTTTLTFDSTGNVTQIQNPRTDLTALTNFTWDIDGRLTSSVQPTTLSSDRPAKEFVYDANSELVTATTGYTNPSCTLDGLGLNFCAVDAIITTYDPASNKIKDADTPTGSSTFSVKQYSYDSDDRVQCTATRMNPSNFSSLPGACTLSSVGSYGQDQITELAYCAIGTSNCAYNKVHQEVRAYGTTIQQNYATHGYNANGNDQSLTDANGNTTTHAYDGFDRLNVTTFPDTSTETVPFGGYDYDNNILSRVNRAGETLTYSFDALDRMVTKGVPGVGSISANTVTWTYDLLTEVAGLSDTLGNVLANTYDLAARKRTAQRTAPGLSGSQTIGYQYDGANNRTQLTWPDGYYVNYSYDALNHPTIVSENGSTTIANYNYDTLGRRSCLQYLPSGTCSGSGGAVITYNWSPESDLLTLSHAFASSTNNVTYTNTFTPAHQILTANISNTAFISIGGANGTTSYAAANSLNQYPSVAPPDSSAQAFTYDGNGNLTFDGFSTYAYDPENRLMTANNASVSAAYAFDPLGRRTAKSGTGVTTTFFLDDDDSEIGEYSASGTLLRRYVPGPDIDESIAMITPSGSSETRDYFHEDKIGSVIAMSSDSGSLVTGPITYDAYGVSLAPSTTVPYGFTGQRLDPETGLYYYRARFYSPGLGRFYQTDPVGYSVDLNLYTYVGNDPVDRIDPTGKADVYYYPDQIIVVQEFDNKTADFSNLDFEGQSRNLEGTSSSGLPVRQVLTPGNGPDAAHYTTNPKLSDLPSDRAPPINAGASNTNHVGGKVVELAPRGKTAGPAVIGHETGHVEGSGDQYKGGRDVNGNVVPHDVPGPPSIMRDYGPGANRQTTDEILHAPTNRSFNCTTNVFESKCGP